MKVLVVVIKRVKILIVIRIIHIVIMNIDLYTKIPDIRSLNPLYTSLYLGTLLLI
jgi:hypothetical protein